MKTLKTLQRCLLLWAALIALAGLTSCASTQPRLIPWPQSVEMQPGAMALSSSSRIVAADPKLLPLAGILSDEVLAVTGLDLPAVSGAGRAGDIFLSLDPSGQTGGYQLAVTDRVALRGGDYKGAAAGTATVLQSLETKAGAVQLPRLRVRDNPHVDYCGAMLDV